MADGVDTIFALSSGAPPSGVAIIRMSGPRVRFGLETLVDSVPEPRRASLRTLRGSDGGPIDRGLVLFYPGPASFTGEDMAELQIHGGRAVINAVLAALEPLPGFRPAAPGEFSRRALINGRIDLTEAEGIADLIAAETEAQRRQALRQASGGLRTLYDGWRERVVRSRALIEAELDFPDEDDVPGSVSDLAWADVSVVADEIARHLADANRGERLREGAEIVVLGPPNAGKSTFINMLAGRDVAIVASEPGTTRDLIEVRLDLGGYPVTVVDTAGLRDAAGPVEIEGIRRASQRARHADLVLWLTAAGSAATAPPVSDGVVLRIGTKLDLIDSAMERSAFANSVDHAISARTGAGVDGLLREITAFVANSFAAAESPLITRSRYRSGLSACRAALIAALEDGRGLELRAEDLRQATDALGRITGRVDVEDLLDVIFRDFCIGK